MPPSTMIRPLPATATRASASPVSTRRANGHAMTAWRVARPRFATGLTSFKLPHPPTRRARKPQSRPRASKIGNTKPRPRGFHRSPAATAHRRASYGAIRARSRAATTAGSMCRRFRRSLAGVSAPMAPHSSQYSCTNEGGGGACGPSSSIRRDDERARRGSGGPPAPPRGSGSGALWPARSPRRTWPRYFALPADATSASSTSSKGSAPGQCKQPPRANASRFAAHFLPSPSDESRLCAASRRPRNASPNDQRLTFEPMSFCAAAVHRTARIGAQLHHHAPYRSRHYSYLRDMRRRYG